MALPQVFTDRSVRGKIKDKIEIVMAFVVVGGYIYSKMNPTPDPVFYGDLDVAGVENVLHQNGDDVVYNLTTQENT